MLPGTRLLRLARRGFVLAGAIAGFIAWLSMVLLPLGALPVSLLARLGGASRADITRLGGVLIIAVVVIVAWVGPHGERTHSSANEDLLLSSWVARGMTETEAREALRAWRMGSADLRMSVPELLRARRFGGPELLRPQRVTAELHRRAALLGLTILMTAVGWRLARRRPRHVVLSVAMWWVGTAGLLLGCWFAAVRAAAVGPMASWMTSWATLAVAAGLAWLVTCGRGEGEGDPLTRSST